MKLLPTLIAAAFCAGLDAQAQDATAPQVVSTASVNGASIGILFNEALDPSTANDPSRFTLTGGASVDAAELQADGTTVLLSVSGLSGGNYSLTVNGVTDLSGNAANATVAGTALAVTAQDLGVVDAPGKAVPLAPGSLDVYARGLDIWGFADSGHFAWEEKTGDFDVRVRLESFSAPAISANAGLMIRENAEPGSRNVQVVTYANQRLWVGAERPDHDGNSRVIAGDWDVEWPAEAAYPNIWLRLKRVGATITTYGSTNGTDWIQVGNSVTPEFPFPDTVLVGLRTTPVEVQAAGSTAVAKYREYGDFVVSSGSINITEQPGDQTIRENTAATLTVAADVTGTSASNLSYQWQRDGEDISGATSATYTTPNLTLADTGAKYRVRLSLPGGVITQTSGEATVNVVQDEIAPSIVSAGSLDGTTVGVCFDEPLDFGTASDAARYTLSSGSVDYAILEADGKTVTLGVSGLTGTSFTLTVDGVTDLVGNPASDSVTGQVLGWTAQDLGFVEAPGRAVSCTAAGVDVWARGLDIWGFADSGHFVWEERTGDFDVRVRV